MTRKSVLSLGIEAGVGLCVLAVMVLSQYGSDQ